MNRPSHAKELLHSPQKTVLNKGIDNMEAQPFS